LKPRCLALLLICALLLGSLTCRSVEAASPEPTAIGLVRDYDRLLASYFPAVPCPGSPPKAWQVTNLMNLICQLASAPIEDPRTLQKLDFTASYPVLAALEKDPDPKVQDLAARWKRLLIQLDRKAEEINNFRERPSAKWVLAKGKSLPAEPTARMLDGYIEREKGTVYISRDGAECGQEKKGCEKLRYVLIQCLAPGVPDVETARSRLHAFPPVRANPRLFDYWEVLLDPQRKLIRRHYGIRPFPGYEGSMENYYEVTYRDPERIVALEQNTREGKFIVCTDNAGVYVLSPPHGVTVALIFSGKYVMEEFFYVLAGDKLLREPVEVMAILRQFIMCPDKGPEAAVAAGHRDYVEAQRPQ
jgi:hypothetical protein